MIFSPVFLMLCCKMIYIEIKSCNNLESFFGGGGDLFLWKISTNVEKTIIANVCTSYLRHVIIVSKVPGGPF